MRPRLSALVAMARNRVIGRNNALPWRLPPDLKRFKALTMGHAIIMGRKTFESIGRPLPGRTSIIVTRQPGYTARDAIVVGSIADALEACSANAADTPASYRENFVIGGAEIFRQTLPMCDRLHITEIQRDFEGDVLFPEFNHDEWVEVSCEKHRDDSGLEYHFVVFDRKTGSAK
ncbi:MAG TPA: dihydrofolate reductase [Nitrosospira sp.]